MIMTMPTARRAGAQFSDFANDTVYRFNVDNDMNGVASNVVYEFRFSTHTSQLEGVAEFPWPHVGRPYSSHPAWGGITALSGAGSEGLAVRQRYSVTQIKNGVRTELFRNQKLVAVPPNIGTATMPDYEALAAQGIYQDAKTGIRVFAGPRANTAYSDSAALFDGLSFSRMPPFLSELEDNSNTSNPFGVDSNRNTNVHSIAIEVPETLLTRDSLPASKTAFPLLGAYASIVEEEPRDGDHRWLGDLGSHRSAARQISRMGNPTFRNFVVPVGLKERWDASRPEHDAQFQNFLKAPVFSRFLFDAVGAPIPPEPRLELLGIILKYPGQPLEDMDCGRPCSDLLRINVQVPPTPAEQQHRLGALLSADQAGLPNGCRPNDDITDITLRAFGGPAYFATRIGDGVNFIERAPGAGTSDGPGYGKTAGNRLDVTSNGVAKEFPFMATPYSSREAVQIAF
jgi:hypothetical protein